MDTLQLKKMTILTIEAVNKRVREAEYAVRGRIPSHAYALEERLKKGEKLPFDEIIWCNIGNPQQLGQKPITFNRQVLACVNLPQLMEKPGLFPKDVIERAKKILDDLPFRNAGGYTHSQGLLSVRKNIAKFITERDGGKVKCDPQNIYLGSGASDCITKVLQCLIKDEKSGILTPVPQVIFFL